MSIKHFFILSLLMVTFCNVSCSNNMVRNDDDYNSDEDDYNSDGIEAILDIIIVIEAMYSLGYKGCIVVLILLIILSPFIILISSCCLDDRDNYQFSRNQRYGFRAGYVIGRSFL